jgi:hypothetical protein
MKNDCVYKDPRGDGFEFEAKLLTWLSSARTPNTTETHANQFLDGLGIAKRTSDLTEGDQRQILQLMERTVLVINWYGTKIKRGQIYYWCFLVFALILTLSLPFIGYSVHLLSTPPLPGGSSWPELVVTLIAGLVVAQSLLKSGFDSRFRFASFWQARSKIKSAALALRDEWRGKHVLVNGRPHLSGPV